MKINFSLNQETKKFEKEIKETFACALNLAGVCDDISVNVVLVSEKEIKNMNNVYRGIDKVTDVLSFPLIDDINQIKNEVDFGFGECNIGDIYINLNRAKQQAEEYGHSLKREFCFLALHGFLHLLGYDHIKEDDEKKMYELQNKVLEIVKINR